MGRETRCRAQVRDADGATREGEGAVLLEGDALIVRGPARTRIPRVEIRSVEAHADGTLIVAHAGGVLTLALGGQAEAWRARLLEPPKPLIDKLDVKPGATVLVVGVRDAAFLAALRERTPHVTTAAPSAPCDVVFLGVERDAELAHIADVAPALAERGALWVVHPRGAGGVPDTAIFAAGRVAGLTATKVARFSATHTAEKLVRPRG